jgi:hypothetical protein
MKTIMATILLTSVVSYAVDYTIDAKKLLDKAPEGARIMASDAFKQITSPSSDGGKEVTKKEFETLKVFLEDMSEITGSTKNAPTGQTTQSTQIKSHGEELKRIAGLPQNSPADKAIMCSQFADLLFKFTRGSSPFIFGAGAGESKIQMTQGFSLPLLKDFSDDDLENMHSIFQACRFAVNKSNVGACDSCKGITRLAVPILVKQKVENERFLSHYISGRPYVGAVPSEDMLVVSSKNIESTGKQYVFALHTGTDKFSMLNGFDKSITTFLDLGADKTSALLCRFNEFSKEMKKRMPKAECGWISGNEDFYNGGFIRLGCASREMLEGNKLKGHNQYYIKFDHQECK